MTNRGKREKGYQIYREKRYKRDTRNKIYKGDIREKCTKKRRDV